MGKCSGCDHCRRMYTRFNGVVFGSKIYYCTAHKEVTTLDRGCADRVKKKFEHGLTLRRIDRAREDVEYLMRIFDKE